MKKLVKPQNAPSEQEESKDQHVERVESFKKRVIPDLSKFNIHKIDDLKGRLDVIKMQNNQYDFAQSMEAVMDLYNRDDLHYSENIVFFVMQEVEKFMLKPKAGEYKQQVCVECCKKYFNNDDGLVSLIIKLLMPKLKQVKFSERQVRKVIRFFSRML